MRLLAFTLSLLLLQTAALTPAHAQMCDTRCDDGEVWTDAQGGTCVPEPRPTS